MKVLLSLFIMMTTWTAMGQGIEFFQGTWKEALAKAKEEEKILFVDSFTTWCGPCKRMAKYVFTDEEVGFFFNKNFINLKLDMEGPDGRTFDQQYPVSAYPTMFFLDGEGKVLKKVKGAKQASDLITLGKDAIKANDQSDKYAALYDEGNRDYDVVYKYVRALNLAGKSSLRIANDYINSRPDISPEEYALFAFESTTEADSRIFDLMLENKKLILDNVSQEEFKSKVIEACKATIKKAIEYDMEVLRDETNEKCIEALGKKSGELENLKLDMEYFAQTGNMENYLKSTDKIVKDFGKNDLSLITHVLEDIEKKFKEDDKAIEKGLDYGKKLYKEDNNPDHAVLYVRMLIHGKKYEKGLDIIDETIDRLDENDRDVSKLKSIRKYVESLKATSNS